MYEQYVYDRFRIEKNCFPLLLNRILDFVALGNGFCWWLVRIHH